MEKTVNIHTAKTTLSKLIAEVESGEEIVIARAGKPVARLVAEKKKKVVAGKNRVAKPSKNKKPKLRADRMPGFLKGKIKILDGFYDPLPEDMLAHMLGEKD